MNSLSKSRILPPHSHEDHSNTVSPVRESRCSRITVSGFAIRKGSFCIDRKSNHLPVHCRTIPAGNTVYNKPALTENPRFLNNHHFFTTPVFPCKLCPGGIFYAGKALLSGIGGLWPGGSCRRRIKGTRHVGCKDGKRLCALSCFC